MEWDYPLVGDRSAARTAVFQPLYRFLADRAVVDVAARFCGQGLVFLIQISARCFPIKDRAIIIRGHINLLGLGQKCFSSLFVLAIFYSNKG
jgi:hypothetical protein